MKRCWIRNSAILVIISLNFEYVRLAVKIEKGGLVSHSHFLRSNLVVDVFQIVEAVRAEPIHKFSFCLLLNIFVDVSSYNP